MLKSEEKFNSRQIFQVYEHTCNWLCNFWSNPSLVFNIFLKCFSHLLLIDPKQIVRSFHVYFLAFYCRVVHQLDANNYTVYSSVIGSRVYLSFTHDVGWCNFKGWGVANWTQLMTIFLIELILNSLLYKSEC